MNVTDALYKRTSIRAFTDQVVTEEMVREIIDAARWAPSGGNLQGWKIIVVSGAEKDACISLAQNTLAANPRGEVGDKPIYPAELGEPYRSRRFKVGEDMYALLGIGRDDKGARFANLAKNYTFFGAPVGMFFVIDNCMGHGQWAHLGMLMQSICLAATERGLATCMQEAWGMVRTSLHTHFALPANEMIYCGLALGYPDPNAPVNALRSDRASVDEITTFRGF